MTSSCSLDIPFLDHLKGLEWISVPISSDERIDDLYNLTTVEKVKTYIDLYKIFCDTWTGNFEIPEYDEHLTSGIILRGLGNVLEIGLAQYLEMSKLMKSSTAKCSKSALNAIKGSSRGSKRDYLTRISSTYEETKELTAKASSSILSIIKQRVISCAKDLFETVLPGLVKLEIMLREERLPEEERLPAQRVITFILEKLNTYQARTEKSVDELADLIDGGETSTNAQQGKSKSKTNKRKPKVKPLRKATTPPIILGGGGEGCAGAGTGGGGCAGAGVASRLSLENTTTFEDLICKIGLTQKENKKLVLHPRVAAFLYKTPAKALSIRKAEAERKGRTEDPYTESMIINGHTIPHAALKTVTQERFVISSYENALETRKKYLVSKNGELRILEVTITKKESMIYHCLHRDPDDRDDLALYERYKTHTSEDGDWWEVAGASYHINSEGNHRYIDKTNGDTWIFYKNQSVSREE